MVFAPVVPVASAVICLVPSPARFDQPAGIVHLYSVVPPKGCDGGGFGNEYPNPVAPRQTGETPVITSVIV